MPANSAVATGFFAPRIINLQKSYQEYPFVLSTGRCYFHFHTGTMTRRTQLLEFYDNVYNKCNNVLNEYDVTDDERIAIITSDIHWIEKQYGDLPKEQRDFLLSRLEIEDWGEFHV